MSTLAREMADMTEDRPQFGIPAQGVPLKRPLNSQEVGDEPFEVKFESTAFQPMKHGPHDPLPPFTYLALGLGEFRIRYAAFVWSDSVEHASSQVLEWFPDAAISSVREGEYLDTYLKQPKYKDEHLRGAIYKPRRGKGFWATLRSWF